MLSKQDIIDRIKSGNIVLDPSVQEDRIAQVSIDLSLGNKFTTFKKPPNYLPHIRVDRSLWESADLWEHHETDSYILEPGEFVLGRTFERICMPKDLVGFVEGRSSWARIGITIHLTAPKIDPGFEGSVTLEMANFGKVAVELRSKIDMPAQLMFFRISQPLDDKELYGSCDTDVFQGQDLPIPCKKK